MGEIELHGGRGRGGGGFGFGLTVGAGADELFLKLLLHPVPEVRQRAPVQQTQTLREQAVTATGLIAALLLLPLLEDMAVAVRSVALRRPWPRGREGESFRVIDTRRRCHGETRAGR